MAVVSSVLSPLLSPLLRPPTDVDGGRSVRDAYAAWLDSLFAGDANGVAVDPSDLATLWLDTGRTQPVTAIGQVVRGITDKSGREHHLSNAAGWKLLNDGANNYLEMVAGSSFATAPFVWGSDKLTAWFGAAASGAVSVMNFGAIASQDGTFNFGYHNNGILLYYRGAGAFSARGTPSVGAFPVVGSVSCDMSQPTRDTELAHLRVDGVQGLLTDYGATSQAGAFGTYPLVIGGSVVGRLYGVVASNALAALEPGEAAMASRTKVTAAVEAMNFLDTGSQANVGGVYQLTSTFAHVDFQTQATALIVSSYNDIFSAFPGFTELGVYIDGVPVQSIFPVKLGQHAASLTLPSGNKVVSIVNGLQSAPSGSPIGTFVTAVVGNAPLVALTPSPTERLLVYGDSIAAGGNASAPSTQGWVPLLRAARAPKSTAAEAWGYRSLYDDCRNLATRTAFVAKLVAYGPAIVWLAIGTNDFGLNKWSAADFGVAYAALLDDLHAALPSTVIYCQTPLLRAVETANGHGSTTADYRSQIATALSSRSAYATLVDGTTILTLADLSDGIHPTTSGHAKYALAVRTVLGF